MRRSATNQATRIAEGAGRPADNEFSAELNRARAANHELEYLLLLAKDLNFLDSNLHDELAAEVIEVRKMISGLVRRLTAGQ
jgi:four helix bundle protein